MVKPRTISDMNCSMSRVSGVCPGPECSKCTFLDPSSALPLAVSLNRGTPNRPRHTVIHFKGPLKWYH